MRELRRCPHARSGQGKPKACVPSLDLAVYLAARFGQIPYPCDTHWHLTKPPSVESTTLDRVEHTLDGTVRDRKSTGRRAADITELAAYARQVAASTGRRRHVYGTRDTNGRWVYRVHLAEFRHSIARTGEL